LDISKFKSLQNFIIVLYFSFYSYSSRYIPN